MNAVAKLKTPPLSPAREALQHALNDFARCQQLQEMHAATVAKNDRLLLAESKAQATLDAITQQEDAELVAWIENGKQGEEPQPHEADRKKAERELRHARGESRSAQRHKVELDGLMPRLIADSQKAADNLHVARLQVVAEICGQVGAEFRRAASRSFALEGALREAEQLLIAGQNNAQGSTGLYQKIHDYTIGNPAPERQQAATNAKALWAKLWGELGTDATAELNL